MKGYLRLIQEFTKCSESEARDVLGRMRDIFGTLDGLDRTRFRREARSAFKGLKTFQAEA